MKKNIGAISNEENQQNFDVCDDEFSPTER